LADLNEVRGEFKQATRKVVEEEVVRAGLEARFGGFAQIRLRLWFDWYFRLVEATDARLKAKEELQSQVVLNATLDVQSVGFLFCSITPVLSHSFQAC